MRRSLVLTVALSAAAASAQDSRPELAPFPLEIIRTGDDCTKKDKDELRTLLPMMIRSAGASVPDGAKLTGALFELRRQDCNRDDTCLAQLSRLAGSLYGLYTQLDFDLDGNVVASGRVVRDDGRAVRAARTVKLPLRAGSFKVVAHAALDQLLAQLDVAQLPPSRPQEPRVEAPSLPPVPSQKPELMLSPPVRPLMPVAVVAMGVGAACFAVGTVLMATTSAPRANVSGSVVRVFAEDAGKVASIQRAQTAGVVLLAVGVGVAAAGAGLFLFGPEKPGAVVVPIAGGAAVVLTGRLP